MAETNRHAVLDTSLFFFVLRNRRSWIFDLGSS